MDRFSDLNHFYLVVCIYFAWTAVLFTVMKGKTILWDYDKFPDETQSK